VLCLLDIKTIMNNFEIYKSLIVNAVDYSTDELSMTNKERKIFNCETIEEFNKLYIFNDQKTLHTSLNYRLIAGLIANGSEISDTSKLYNPKFIAQAIVFLATLQIDNKYSLQFNLTNESCSAITIGSNTFIMWINDVYPVTFIPILHPDQVSKNTFGIKIPMNTKYMENPSDYVDIIEHQLTEVIEDAAWLFKDIKFEANKNAEATENAEAKFCRFLQIVFNQNDYQILSNGEMVKYDLPEDIDFVYAYLMEYHNVERETIDLIIERHGISSRLIHNCITDAESNDTIMTGFQREIKKRDNLIRDIFFRQRSLVDKTIHEMTTKETAAVIRFQIGNDRLKAQAKSLRDENEKLKKENVEMRQKLDIIKNSMPVFPSAIPNLQGVAKPIAKPTKVNRPNSQPQLGFRM